MVQVLTSELVVPAGETPRGGLWLSNLDLAARRGYTPTIYFYRPSAAPGFFAAGALRDSLARALVAFYPLAGRLGVDGHGRLEVNCTGEGAVFVTARSDLTVDELVAEFAPSDEMRDLFVPPAPAPDPPCVLLLLQVTYLKCGGVVLGTAMHHTVVDARSASHFVETWARIARGATADALLPPFHDRTLLRARHPPTVAFDHAEYNSDTAPPHGATSLTYASAILTLADAQVAALKARASASTFRAVVALVWRCVCRARALPPGTQTRLFTMIDMRPRLTPPLPPGYFGNAVVRTSVAATAGEVAAGPVGDTARLVRAATSQGDDYARSLIDHLEAAGAGAVPRSGISRAHLRAISWLGMALYDADFGWGEPAFMGPALMYYPGFVYVMNAPGKDGGVALALSLEPETMPEFRKAFGEELARLDVQ